MHDYTLLEQLSAAVLILITLAGSLGGIAALVLYLNPGDFDEWPSDRD